MIEESKENYNKYLEHNKETHKMTIIKAQTGIGKTKLYEEAIKDGITHYVIAVPTNALKEQVYNGLVKLGVANVKQTPELKLINDEQVQKRVNHLRDIGAFTKRKEYLQQALDKFREKKKSLEENNKEIPEGLEQDIDNISFYLSENEVINHYEGHIVTTHERIFHLHWCLRFTHDLIIDEDILSKCIQVKTYEIAKLRVTCQSLNKVNKNQILSGYYGKNLQEKEDIILKAPYKEIKAVTPISSIGDSDIKKEIEEAISEKDIYDIFDILSIKAVYKYNTDKEKMQNKYNNDDLVHCLICRKLPNMRTTIFSATINKNFYKKYFFQNVENEKIKSDNFEYIEIPKAKYMGKLIQDCTYSYSRACLDKHPEILNKIKEKHKGLPLITFKKYQISDKDYHFGALEGINENDLERSKHCNCRVTVC